MPQTPNFALTVYSPSSVFEHALKVMAETSIQQFDQKTGSPFAWKWAKPINPDEFRQTAHAEFSELTALGPPSLEDTLLIIDRAIMRLGDHHSILISPHYYTYNFGAMRGLGGRTDVALALSWQKHKATKVKPERLVSYGGTVSPYPTHVG